MAGNNTMASGFDKMCRTCAACTDNLVPIFSGEGLVNSLADKIHRHLPIQVMESDRLPQQLCGPCANTLLAWHELVKCCTQADAALRVRLQRLAQSAAEEDSAVVTDEVVKEEKPQQQTEEPEKWPQYRCAHCDAHFTQRAVYRDHLASVHIHVLFHCQECDEFEHRDKMREHMARHAEQYDRAFSDSDESGGFGELPASVLQAIEDAPGPAAPAAPAAPPARVCGVCGKRYAAASSYFYHVKYAHGERERRHACGSCERRFRSRAGLAEHERVHTGERPHACARCGKTFRSKAGLYIHAQDVHSPLDKRYSCSDCGKSFYWRQKLILHFKRHRRERTHACETCGRAFSAKCDLTRHKRVHETSKPHACAHCAATFAQRRYLQQHVARKHPPQ